MRVSDGNRSEVILICESERGEGSSERGEER